MIKIERQRADVGSLDTIKNTCPVCGYLTLNERNAFDICGICFWEDDGVDDFDENEESGPNRMTLREGREVFQEAKSRLMDSDASVNSFLYTLRTHFMQLDGLIENGEFERLEILRLLGEILDLLMKNEIYGIDKLFGK